MKMKLPPGIAVAGLLLLNCQAQGQSADSARAASEPQARAFYASGYAFFIPDDRDYVSPIFTADRGRLHLEARYNYEDLETASLFLGWNFSAGEKLLLEATPMIAGVFGNTAGIAPGYKFTLSYHRFELYNEGEYVFDADDSAENFFYSWSELNYALTDWFRAGIVAQRTKAYKTDLEVQRGLLAGCSFRKVDFTAFVFNAGWTSPTVVVALGYSI